MPSPDDRQTAWDSRLVDELTRARQDGVLLESPPGGGAVANLDHAYRLADALTERLGGTAAAWKIGASSAGAQTFLGLQEPFWGAVLPTEVFSSPARRPSLGAPFEVEPEVILCFGRDLDPDAPSKEGLLSCLAGAWIGMEVNRPSYARPFEAGGLCIVADKGANLSLVVGSAIPDWRIRDLSALSLTLVVAGAPGEAVTPAGSGFDPLEAVMWLARDKAKRGRPLRAGDLIATGAVGRARPLQAGETAQVLWEGRPVAELIVEP